uniref:Uncharacterized protein n=1 Tax=Panstrongylus lignarius TaxID=156445 RepID=A0A224Y063_9HEMI
MAIVFRYWKSIIIYKILFAAICADPLIWIVRLFKCCPSCRFFNICATFARWMRQRKSVFTVFLIVNYILLKTLVQG